MPPSLSVSVGVPPARHRLVEIQGQRDDLAGIEIPAQGGSTIELIVGPEGGSFTL